MTIEIVLSEDQLQHLSILRDLSDDTVSNIINELKELKPTPLKPEDLSLVIKKYTPHVELILRLLLSLYNIRRQANVSSSELLDALTSAIEKAKPTWAEDQREKWKDRHPLFQQLFSLEPIWTVVKGIDLSYDYTNLLQNIKILTDIRPIFDEDASTIKGSIISHSLRISYNTRETLKNITLAMDTEDINNLLESCERALKKAKTSKYVMQEYAKIPTFIAGEEKK